MTSLGDIDERVLDDSSSKRSNSCYKGLSELLDYNAELLLSDDQSIISKAMDHLTDGLGAIRDRLSIEEWLNVVAYCRNHRLRHLVHQDPFTSRSFNKPDGYPGDARLLDFIYGQGEYETCVQNSSKVGRSIYLRNRMAPACLAVRNRKHLIADEIGHILKTRSNARIMSVACGHLREVHHVPWSLANSLGLFVAFDQDPTSLEVARQHIGAQIAIRHGQITAFLRDKFDLSNFDLVYALGLYDYLDQRLASRLTSKLFALLSSGGKLVIGNFCKRPIDRGYMEVYMDWFLHFRDENEMLSLADDICVRETASRTVYSEPQHQIMFLEVVKA